MRPGLGLSINSYSAPAIILHWKGDCQLVCYGSDRSDNDMEMNRLHSCGCWCTRTDDKWNSGAVSVGPLLWSCPWRRRRWRRLRRSRIKVCRCLSWLCRPRCSSGMRVTDFIHRRIKVILSRGLTEEMVRRKRLENTRVMGLARYRVSNGVSNTMTVFWDRVSPLTFLLQTGFLQ